MLSRLAAALSAACLVLAGCGADETSSDVAADAPYNEADVAFATEMMQHHAQALVLVDLTVDRDLDPEVVALTDQVRAAQTPEIEQMADWLTEWDQPVPETMRDHANAHGDQGHMEDSDMPGMVTGAELEELAALEGDAFQDRWLELMIAHHEGAIEMAETEVADGEHTGAVRLAEDVVESQQAEIDQMEQLLGS